MLTHGGTGSFSTRCKMSQFFLIKINEKDNAEGKN
jgi:hypothetical protein